MICKNGFSSLTSPAVRSAEAWSAVVCLLLPTEPTEHIPVDLSLGAPLHDIAQRHWIAAIARRRPERRCAGHGW